MSSTRSAPEQARSARQTPFLDLVAYETTPNGDHPNGDREQAASAPATVAPWSPFASLYETENGTGAIDRDSELVTALATELHDDEFDELLHELMTEIIDMRDQFVRETGARGLGPDGTRRLETFVDGVALEVVSALEAIEERAGGRDLSDEELGAVMSGYSPQTMLSPQIQQWSWKAAKNLWNKAKNVAKKVAKTAVTVAKTAATLGLGPILKKLKGLVRPLLKRVLNMAIGKLPAAVQPIAKQLAAKYLKIDTEVGAPAQPAEAAVDVDGAQQEFNYLFAHLLVSESDVEEEVLVRDYAAEAQTEDDTVQRLDEARERFVAQVRQLKPDEDPTPAVQEFVPAILPALKLGIKLAGRQRVVGFIAKLVAKLIKRFVGPKYAPALSQALVDVGLRLINLEATVEDADEAAARVVAYTVEDTVRRLAQAPEYLLERDDLLEAELVSAFERSAAENLPQVLPEAVYDQRPELRETTMLKGAWIPESLTGAAYYDKFTATPEVDITPHVADQVKTFGGQPLSAFLKNRLGIAPGRSVRARMHLYRNRPRGWRALIAAREKRVRGLGKAVRAVRSQLHPLTPEAAGVLLREPGLGGEIPPDQMADGDLNRAGQRFYFLEITGAAPQAAPGPDGTTMGRRPSEVNVKVDFARDEIVASAYLSEADAQALASKLRQRAPIGYPVHLVTTVAAEGLKRALGDLPGHVRFIQGALTPQDVFGGALQKLPAVAKDTLRLRLQDWLGRRLSERLESLSADVVAATEQPADGITLVVTFKSPPGLAAIRRVLSGEPPALRNGWFAPGTPDAAIRIAAGFQRD